MVATILKISEIVSDPSIRSGRPIIAGTSLCVSDVVLAHTSGDHLTPEQIADHYRLSLGQVYATLAYYHLNQEEVDREIRQNAEEAEELLAKLEKQGRLTRLG